jgi:hypothetical protein
MGQAPIPTEQLPTAARASTQAHRGYRGYRGTVAYIYAFDVAHAMTVAPIKSVLGQPTQVFNIDLGKRGPREQFFYRPQMVRLPPVAYQTAWGPVPVERTVKLFPVGAISLVFRVPFAVAELGDLVAYHALSLDGVSHHMQARRLVEQVCADLGPALVRPVALLRDEEAYTVFCIESPAPDPARAGPDGGFNAEDWLRTQRRQVAALLTEEPDAESLSAQETNDTARVYLSYYGHDLVVVDWDAALVIDDMRDFDEALHIMELANVQLAELEAYDRLLDEALERSYRDLASHWRFRDLGGGAGRAFHRRWLAPGLTKPGFTKERRARRHIMRELRELRLDLAHLSDELSNTTKFFGDWHLARVYRALSIRFHMDDWQKIIEEKLGSLEDLYHLLQQDVTNRWMMIMEVTVVLLFIFEIVIVLLGWAK